MKTYKRCEFSIICVQRYLRSEDSRPTETQLSSSWKLFWNPCKMKQDFFLLIVTELTLCLYTIYLNKHQLLPIPLTIQNYVKVSTFNILCIIYYNNMYIQVCKLNNIEFDVLIHIYCNLLLINYCMHLFFTTK